MHDTGDGACACAVPVRAQAGSDGGPELEGRAFAGHQRPLVVLVRRHPRRLLKHNSCAGAVYCVLHQQIAHPHLAGWQAD